MSDPFISSHDECKFILDIAAQCPFIPNIQHSFITTRIQSQRLFVLCLGPSSLLDAFLKCRHQQFRCHLDATLFTRKSKSVQNQHFRYHFYMMASRWLDTVAKVLAFRYDLHVSFLPDFQVYTPSSNSDPVHKPVILTPFCSTKANRQTAFTRVTAKQIH